MDERQQEIERLTGTLEELCGELRAISPTPEEKEAVFAILRREFNLEEKPRECVSLRARCTKCGEESGLVNVSGLRAEEQRVGAMIPGICSKCDDSTPHEVLAVED